MTAPKGEYRGKPSSPDSVKQTIVVSGLTVKLDRPKGFVMRGMDRAGKAWERTYGYDYGFIPGTQGGDGEGLDVFVGPTPATDAAYWARQIKDDGSFDEYKCFLNFRSAKAAERAFKEHIPEKYFSGMFEVPLGAMKALLGLRDLQKVAFRLALLDQLVRLGAAPHRDKSWRVRGLRG